MALHGTIGINGDILGAWSARRTEPLEPERREYTYDCEARWVRDGVVDQRDQWSITHRYSDGMGLLAARVMAHAAGIAPDAPAIPGAVREAERGSEPQNGEWL